MSRWQRSALAIVGALALAACSGGDDDGAAQPTTTAPPTTGEATTTTAADEAPVPLDDVELAVQEVAELDRPVAFAARPSSPDLYVAEQGGRVRVIEVTQKPESEDLRYELQDDPVLDLTEEVISGGERGLLGIAFSSDGRHLYLDLTVEPNGDTRVLEYAMDDKGKVDPESRRTLLEVEQPYANHNGGHVVLGPDGYLYVGLGDGGGRGDPHGNAQDRSTLLGKILRIDPEGADADQPYAVPSGNPFANEEDARPEIWLYGVRNPWRFSFDRTTGDLWVADVGQNSWEEIDWLPSVRGFDAGRGANLGWDRMEGTHEFEGDNPAGAVLPIFEYPHGDGCAITGGFVYRGQALADLQGAFLFADYCASGVRGIRVDGATVLDDHRWLEDLNGIVSFGEDQHGEVFVLLQGGPVLKLVPPGSANRDTDTPG